jgi:DNA-binding NtrC family response regulator
MLVQHFIAPFVRAGKSLRFAPEAMHRLQEYEWPGNIRELRNLIERLLILHEGEEVSLAMLPREVARITAPVVDAAPEADAVPGSLPSLAQIERRHVERVLQATGWNKARAARVLEVDIKTLNKKIRDFGITRTA